MFSGNGTVIPTEVLMRQHSNLKLYSSKKKKKKKKKKRHCNNNDLNT